MVEKSGIEKSGVEESGVEKFEVEMSCKPSKRLLMVMVKVMVVKYLL